MQGQLRSAPARASLLFRWATQFDAAQLATAALRYSGSRCASTDAGNFPSPLDLVKQRMGNLEQPASSPTGQESEYQPLESSRGRGGSVTQQDSYERVTGTEVDPNGTPESLGASHSRGFKAEHGRQDPLGASASVEGSTSDVKAHWLERRFPGAHDWLQRNTRYAVPHAGISEHMKVALWVTSWPVSKALRLQQLGRLIPPLLVAGILDLMVSTILWFTDTCVFTRFNAELAFFLQQSAIVLSKNCSDSSSRMSKGDEVKHSHNLTYYFKTQCSSKTVALRRRKLWLRGIKARCR